MSVRAYILRLALLVLIFFVVIPGIVAFAFYHMNHSPPWPDAGGHFNLFAFFVIMPLWLLGLAITLCWTASARAHTVGFPAWAPLTLLVCIGADWRFFLWLFEHTAPFFSGGLVLLIALALLPERAVPTGDLPPPGRAFQLAMWALVVEAVFAGVSAFASLGQAATTGLRYFRLPFPREIGWLWPVLDGQARQVGFWWVFVLAIAMLWAIVEAWRPQRAA
jgi:hypothetical protein